MGVARVSLKRQKLFRFAESLALRSPFVSDGLSRLRQSHSRSNFLASSVLVFWSMEGCTAQYAPYTHTSFPRSLLSFLYSAVWRQTTKHDVTFDLLYSKIWNFNRVRVLIFLSLGCNLLLWFELNIGFPS